LLEQTRNKADRYPGRCETTSDEDCSRKKDVSKSQMGQMSYMFGTWRGK
jgi:hypothetical protein